MAEAGFGGWADSAITLPWVERHVGEHPGRELR